MSTSDNFELQELALKHGQTHWRYVTARVESKNAAKVKSIRKLIYLETPLFLVGIGFPSRKKFSINNKGIQNQTKNERKRVLIIIIPLLCFILLS